jgi:hypothetical protein
MEQSTTVTIRTGAVESRGIADVPGCLFSF